MALRSGGRGLAMRTSAPMMAGWMHIDQHPDRPSKHCVQGLVNLIQLHRLWWQRRGARSHKRFASIPENIQSAKRVFTDH